MPLRVWNQRRATQQAVGQAETIKRPHGIGNALLDDALDVVRDRWRQ